MNVKMTKDLSRALPGLRDRFTGWFTGYLSLGRAAWINDSVNDSEFPNFFAWAGPYRARRTLSIRRSFALCMRALSVRAL